MFQNAPTGIHTIRGVMGVCHLLVDQNGYAVLLDTGLAGEPWLIRRRLAQLALGPYSIKAIVLTHGHIDRVGNLAWDPQGSEDAVCIPRVRPDPT
jgi:glyoxylase-like metal-dependent hydrolase (beta-lactamase superfamily II)